MSDQIDGAFHVASDEFDVAALRQRVVAGLARRALLDPDPAALLARFGEPTEASARDEVAFAVEQLRMILDNPLPSDRMVRATTPFGALTDRAREPLHAIARYYVDALASRQDQIASWVATALGALAHDVVMDASSPDAAGAGRDEQGVSVVTPARGGVGDGSTVGATGVTTKSGGAIVNPDLATLAADVAALRGELRALRAEITAIAAAIAADAASGDQAMPDAPNAETR